MKRFSREPWFGKKVGVGMRPMSWQGWFVTTIFLVTLFGLLVFSLLNYQYVWTVEAIILALIIVFVGTAVVTSDKLKRL